jgi:cobalt/nickel transport system ATP-binding protein
LHSSHASRSGSTGDPPDRPWAVEVDDLRFTYPDGTRALGGIRIRIAPNEIVGVVGPNGAGKTTLLLHLNGILRGPGTVRIHGGDIEAGRLKEVRREVGLVFQDPDDQLFLPRVFDDVAFGPLSLGLPREEVESHVARALASVGMDLAARRSTLRLSEGEKKRVAIATVLACDPSILVFDEPTANLDPKQRRSLLNWIRGAGKTVIVASHDLEFVLELCGRVIVLAAGEVRADGPAREVLGDSGLMERWGLETPASLLRGEGSSR